MCFSDSPAKVRRRSVYRKEASPDAAKTVRCGGRSGWTKWYNCKAVVFSKDHLGGDFNYFFIFTPNLGVAWSNLTFYFLTCFFFNRQLLLVWVYIFKHLCFSLLAGRQSPPDSYPKKTDESWRCPWRTHPERGEQSAWPPGRPGRPFCSNSFLCRNASWRFGLFFWNWNWLYTIDIYKPHAPNLNGILRYVICFL